MQTGNVSENTHTPVVLDRIDVIASHACATLWPRSLHMMRDCWLEPYTLRPSFTDVVLMLENIMENDAVRSAHL